jgi:hypothetical protein
MGRPFCLVTPRAITEEIPVAKTKIPAPDTLDRPLRGWKAIAEFEGILDDRGKPNKRRVLAGLKSGTIPGFKNGIFWESTPRLSRDWRIAQSRKRMAQLGIEPGTVAA